MAVLDYARERGAERCPDDAELRDAVSARLGYVPFLDAAPLRVRTRIAGDRSGLLATVETFDVDGAMVGQRSIRSRTRDCEELARGVALAISVAIDPMSLAGPPPEPVPPPVVEPVPPPVVEPVPPPVVEPVPPPPPPVEPAPVEDVIVPPPSAGRPTTLALGVDAALAYGAVPSVRPGGDVRVVVEHARFAAELTLRGLVPGSASSYAGHVVASVVDAHLVGCLSAAPLRACGGGYAGAMIGRGAGVSYLRRDVGAVAGFSAVVGLDHAFGSRVGVAVRLGLDVPVLRARLELDGVEVWQGARVSPWASVGAVVRIR